MRKTLIPKAFHAIGQDFDPLAPPFLGLWSPRVPVLAPLTHIRPEFGAGWNTFHEFMQS